MRNGEIRRGGLVMLGVLGMFLAGVLVGGVDCVDRNEDFLWFLAQCGAGPVAFATDALNAFLVKSGRVGELLNTMQPDGSTAPISTFKGVGGVGDVGTLFTAMAGLMNVTAVLDALRVTWKAIRLPSLERYWREVGWMSGQILLGMLALAVGLTVLVQWVVPLLPAD
jgi:hypothetical protein